MSTDGRSVCCFVNVRCDEHEVLQCRHDTRTKSRYGDVTIKRADAFEKCTHRSHAFGGGESESKSILGNCILATAFVTALDMPGKVFNGSGAVDDPCDAPDDDRKL